MGNISQSSKRRAEKEFDVYFNYEQKQNNMNETEKTRVKKRDDDFMVWYDLFGILAWKFKPTESGDMFLDSEQVYKELKDKFRLIKIK